MKSVLSERRLRATRENASRRRGGGNRETSGQGGRDDWRSFGVVQPPVSVREAVRRRVASLGEEAASVLSVAAVAGRRFDLDLISDLTGTSETALIPILRELVAAHLIVEESPDRFAFRHALTQQAGRAGLLGRERRRLHRQVAVALQRRGNESEVPELAHRFFEAQAWEEAARYAEIAGVQALAVFSPGAAAAQFTRALDARRNSGMRSTWALHWSRARAFDTLGEFEAARQDYEAAAATATGGANDREAWQALLDLGLLWAGRDYQEARRCFEESRVIEPARDEPDVLARTLNRLGNAYVNSYKEMDRAVAMHQEALGLEEQLGNEQRIAESHDLLGMASFQGADLQRGDVHYERAIAAFRALNDRYGLSSSLAMRALSGGATFTQTEAGSGRDWTLRIAEAEEAQRLAVESGWRPGEAFASCVLAWVATPMGSYQLALDAGIRALSIAEEIEHRQWTIAALCAVGNTHAAILGTEEARHHLERAFSLASELSSPLWACNIGSSLIELCARGGEVERAGLVLGELERHRVYPRALHARAARAARATFSLATGDPEAALAAAEELTASAANPHGHPIPSLLALRGEALAALGRIEEALDTYNRAVEAAEEAGKRTLLWRCSAGRGRVAGRSGHRALALEAFERARAVVTELAAGMNRGEPRDRFLSRAQELLPPPREPTTLQAAKSAFAGLTEREREVAGLIVQGLTNSAIADRLVVGQRTVEAHVSHILAKLGATSRAQIAAWAVAQALAKSDSPR